MYSTDPHDALVMAHEHARHLRDEAAAERFRRTRGTRHALAGSLRRLADRLDPDLLETGPFAPRPA